MRSRPDPISPFCCSTVRGLSNMARLRGSQNCGHWRTPSGPGPAVGYGDEHRSARVRLEGRSSGGGCQTSTRLNSSQAGRQPGGRGRGCRVRAPDEGRPRRRGGDSRSRTHSLRRPHDGYGCPYPAASRGGAAQRVNEELAPNHPVSFILSASGESHSCALRARARPQ